MKKIETFAVVAFLIIVAFFSLGGGVGKIFSSSSINNNITDWEKLEAEDEKLHEEWASENADSDIYQFVHCEGDSNTYPEGTKCDDNIEDEDDNEEENDKEDEKD